MEYEIPRENSWIMLVAFRAIALDVEAVIVKNKQIVTTADSKGNTLLHYVSSLISSEHTQAMIKSLITHGAKVQALNREGCSALHFAAEKNNVLAVCVLLDNGAFINGINYEGLTPCHLAAISNSTKAFNELKTRKAALNLVAFPSALKRLPFSWNVNQPLTAVNLLERKTDPIEPEVKPVFKSMGYRGLFWVENTLGLSNHYASATYVEVRELEETTTYQRLSMAKMGISMARSLFLGPYFVAIEGVKQLGLYGRPMLMGAAGQFYYYAKPSIHNYTWPCVSTSFDYGSTGLSYATEGFFKVMNGYDFVNNVGRRVTGVATGVSLLKLAQRCGLNNKEYQAATLFLAKELGYALVDSYHEASPEKKAHKALTANQVDQSLNHAYKVWSAILGKEKGESFISAANLAGQWQDNFYANLGEIERGFFEKIEGYTAFQKNIGEFNAFIGGNVSFYATPIDFIKLQINGIVNGMAEYRDRFLIGLNRVIHDNLTPDSEYRTVMLIYAHNQKLMLCRPLLQETEQQLRQAEAEENQKNIASLQSYLEQLKQEISQSEACVKQYSEQLANGKFMHQYHAAQQKAFNSCSDKHHLETIKELNPESFVDMAYQDLGNDLVAEELAEYLAIMVSSQNIVMNQHDLASFKLSIDATRLPDPAYKDVLKSTVASFWHTQVDKHVMQATASIAETFEQSKNELEVAAKEFAVGATPEELRVLALDEKVEVKTQKYDLILNQKNQYIQKIALTQARYATFIRASLEYEKVQLDLIVSEVTLEQTELNCTEEIKYLNKIAAQLQKDFDKIANNPDINPLITDIKKVIVSGREGGEDRDKTTKLMLNWIVSTGLISQNEAESYYKHVFYESLKNDKNAIEPAVTKILNQALKEVFDKAQAPIVETNKKISEVRQEIENAKLQVQVKTDALARQKEILAQTKEVTLTKLTPAEHYQFKSFSSGLIENIIYLNQFNQAVMEQYFAEKHYQETLAQKQETGALLEKTQLELEKLNNFSVTPEEMWNAVKATYCQGKFYDQFERIQHIVNFFVNKGLSNYQHLLHHFWNTLVHAQQGYRLSQQQKHIQKRLIEQVAVLEREFIPQKKASLKDSADQLQGEGLILEQDLVILEEKLKNANTKMALAKTQYLEKLTPEEQESFYQKETANKAPIVLPIKSQDNLPDWRYPAKIIDGVVDKAFAEYTDRTKLAEFFADQIMLFRSQLYPEKRDAEAIEKERQLYISEIKGDELNRFERRQRRAKNRVYDYILAKVTNAEKKIRPSRFDRVVKSGLNEIIATLTGGHRPFKDFSGGEDKKGQAGLQLNYSTDGTFGVNVHANNVPMFNLYQSEKPTRIPEPAQPAIFQKNLTPVAANEPVAQNQVNLNIPRLPMVDASANIPSLSDSLLQGGVFQQAFPGPLRAEHLPESVKNPGISSLHIPVGYQEKPLQAAAPSEEQGYSTLYADNAFIQKQLASEHNKLFGAALHLGAEPAASAVHKPPQATQPKPTVKTKEQAPKRMASAAPVIFSQQGSQVSGASAWSSVHQAMLGDTSSSVLNLGGPRQSIVISAEWLATLRPKVDGRVPIIQLPNLMWEALGESAQELYVGTISLAQFAKREVVHVAKGESLETTQAIALLSNFIGEEAARAKLGQDLESVKMVKQMMADFDNLSQEEKIKSGIKLYLSFVSPSVILKAAQTSGKLTGQVVTAVKKADKTVGSQPVEFSKPVAHHLKDSKNLPELMGKLQEVPDAQVPHSVHATPKTFTQFYDVKITPSALASESSSSSLFKLIESNSINKTADFNQIVINTSKPIEIYHGYGELSARQTKILEQLPKYESSIYLHKNDVNVVDLAALTAKTGDEFALFTLGARRMIVRGDSRGIDIADILPKLQAEKWTWSAHTHPGTRDIALNASGIPGDRQILELLGQNRSLIVNSAGRRNVFDTENDMHITNKTVNTKLRNKND